MKFSNPWINPPASGSHPGVGTGLKRGFARRCPACGQGKLFCGYLAVEPVCPVCGNDNDQYPSDDFSPYLTIFVVLHLLVPPFVVIDRLYNPSVALEAAIAVPVFIAATLAALPFIKGAVIGLCWALDVRRDAA